MQNKQLPITCPICGKKNGFALENLKEGGIFHCPNCQVKITLHGHMWEEIQRDLAKMGQEN